MQATRHLLNLGRGWYRTARLVAGRASWRSALFALFALKPLVTALCLGAGGSGGLFTPTLALGALLGGALGDVWSSFWPGVPPGVFAVLGARTFDGSADTGRLLARAHPSGQWIEWLG